LPKLPVGFVAASYRRLGRIPGVLRGTCDTQKAFDFSTPQLRDQEVDGSKSMRPDQIQL